MLMQMSSCVPHFSLPLPSFLQLTHSDLSYNKIKMPIDDEDVNYFTSQSLLIDLVLSHNLLSRINKNTFQGLQSLQVLDLEGNLINYIHPEAFVHLVGLRDL